MDRQDDIERIGDGLVRLRLMIGRRVIGRTAMAHHAAMMEISALDALWSVPGPGAEDGAMINDIARSLRVDQSRASRLVSTLVKNGLVERRVSSTDARRARVVRTARGDDILREIERIRNDLIASVTADWPAGEREVFSRLFARFLEDFDKGLSDLEEH